MALRLLGPLGLGPNAPEMPQASDQLSDSGKNCLAAVRYARSLGPRTVRCWSAKKLRLVSAPSAIMAEPTSSTYQGSGVSHDSSTPRPLLPSAPNTRPSAKG